MASILQKSSNPALPFLTLGSICLAHFLLSPLSLLLFESSSSIFARSNQRKTVSTWSSHGDEADNSSHLLEHVPDDVYSQLYVASKSYLIQNELRLDENEDIVKHGDHPDLSTDLDKNICTNLDPTAVEKSLVSLMRQGSQAFAVDEFENFVDFSAFSGKIYFVGEADLGVDAQLCDGGEGSGGSGDYGSGSGAPGSGGGESGGGGQPSRTDSGEAASGGGSGGYGSGTDFSGSGSGSAKDGCCTLQ